MRRILFVLLPCLLLAGLPGAAQAITLQAERGAKVRGPAVKRSGSVLLQGRATVSRTVSTKVLLRIQARARAQPCRGWPVMRISVDGRTVARVKVGSRRWRSYGGLKTAKKGRHKVVVRFLNPRRTKRCRRALALDSFILTERRTPKPAPKPSPPAAGAAVTPPGHYLNPVYGGPGGGGFADPMVLDVGGRHNDYWAYATGGLFPVARSSDLVNWTGAGGAMTSRPAWTDQAGEWNPWAPSVIERDEPCPGAASGPCFLMFFTAVNRLVEPDTNCIGIATSPSPAGPFTDRGILDDAEETRDLSSRPIGCGDDAGYSNIDAAPFVDADGEAYLYLSTGHRCAAPAAGVVCPWDRQLSVIPLAEDLMSATGARQELVGNGAPWEQGIVENPWPMPNGDAFDLVYSGGNYRRAYGMGSARGTGATGPFTKVPGNPFLHDSGSALSIGGGMVTTGPKGKAVVAYHGRTAAYSQPRTLRIDPVSRAAGGTFVTKGPSSTPQPNP